MTRNPPESAMLAADQGLGSAAPHHAHGHWRERFALRLALSDATVLTVVVIAVQLIWFGTAESHVAGNHPFGFAFTYSMFSAVLIVLWVASLGVAGSWGYRVLGSGSQEYKFVVDATARIFGLLAAVAFLFQVDFARGYILLALPLGLGFLVLTRWVWRNWITKRRRAGEFMSRVVVVGCPEASWAIARELRTRPEAGFEIVGLCHPSGETVCADDLEDLPLVDFGMLPAMMAELSADTVMLTSSQDLTPQRVREISWSLEPGRQHLVVAPGLVDVGGPRIHARPVAGMPLLHVETPRYEGIKLYSKRAFDIVCSGLLILLLSPILLATAISVRLGSPGPVLFRQPRIGHRGSTFSMLKFRSMVVDAEDRLTALREADRDAGNTVLFKLRDDPRVTRTGRFIRRYSIDELPQLFNVLFGDMSLVGPRPPLAAEVAEYENHVHRRFLVKPGITGLWQVSGRSNLSWAESVRLDLYYVENWSPTSDIIILWKTLRAVVKSDGAY